MITAKDFWNNACKNEELKSPADILIEFAKMHVKASLEGVYNDIDISENIQSILNSYPLENIK